jgi:hypothetical protein
MFKAFELERAGNPDSLGIGAVRVFVTRATRAREEVIALVPDRQLSYILLSGLPFRNYRADVLLEPDLTGGTRITWSARFDANTSWMAWFWKLFMQRVLASIASNLAKGAADPSIVAAAEKHLSESKTLGF